MEREKSLIVGLNRVEVPCQDTSERYENLYAMLLEAIPSSVLLIDQDMRIVFANRSFLEKNQDSSLNTIGCRLEEVLPAIILSNMHIISEIRQVLGNNQPTEVRRMTYRAPGIPMRIYNYRLLPFFWHGIVENVMLLMDDVTDQVRLNEEVGRVERHLASVVETASDIVLSTDIEGRILTWNAAGEKISGYTFDEVKGRFFFEFFAENYQEDVKKIFSIMKNGKSSQMAEWDLMVKHGDSIPVYWVCSPMKDSRFRPMGMVAVGMDLTERRKFEMQLFQSQKLAALGVMAGGIAHEIRNPLAICSSAAQFLMGDDITPEFQKECANKIHAGIHRASFIIENLLRFARLSTRTDLVQLDLVSLLKETLTLVANQARIQKILLAQHFPEETILVNGIASLLEQMFMNLFLNAIKAMPDGGTLTIAVERRVSEVLVRVKDTGRGIYKGDIDKVFDPFYTKSPVGKGTGLGLSICYSIVKQHFGTIEAGSVEGRGSTFTVKLPVI